ncbi:heme-binding protein 2 isoform X1 [Conger conger]|uniref:heme-binding protein 2 isoform X1 n=2 Tax=Conger conger TaxID=82655 RepID=UPI002A5A18A9|nr:heme-binding protein 2 isoform X1 [Conger conger]
MFCHNYNYKKMRIQLRLLFFLTLHVTILQGGMFKAVQQALFSTSLQLPKFIPGHSKSEDYDVRTYQSAKWVSTRVTGLEYDPAISTGFRRLFRYIQGSNEQKEKVEMTAPVTCLVDPGAGPACETTFTVSFYLPEEHQADPPKPTDPDLFIEDRKEHTVFVSTFGGFSNQQKSRDQLLQLMKSLQRDGLEFQEKLYYTAGYDSPFKLTNRRNEVWLLKKPDV